MPYSHRFRWPALGMTVLVGMMLVGCEIFNGDDDDDRDRTRGGDRIGRVESTTGVPATAERVGDGRGELSYRAEADGTIYLYDPESKILLDRRTLRRGQRYTIDPTRSIATVDGKTVWDRTMDPKHAHRLYFDRSR